MDLFQQEKERANIAEDKANQLESLFEAVEDYQRKLSEFIVYKDLREKGYHIKSGLKYGVEFRVYEKGVRREKGHRLPQKQ